MMRSYRITGMIISKTQRIFKNRTEKQNSKKEVQNKQALSVCSTDNISNNSFKNNASGVHTPGSEKSINSGDISVYTQDSQRSINSGASSYSASHYANSSVSSGSDIFREEYEEASKIISLEEDIEKFCGFSTESPKANTGKKDIISVSSSTNDIQTVKDTSQQPKSINIDERSMASKDTNSNNNNNVNLKNIPKNLRGRTAQLGRFLQKNVLSSPLGNVTPIQSIKKKLNVYQESRVDHQEAQAKKQKTKLSDNYFDGQRDKLIEEQKTINTNIGETKKNRTERLNVLKSNNTNNRVVQFARFIEKNVLIAPLENITPIQSMKKKLNSIQKIRVDHQEAQAKKQAKKISNKYFDGQRENLIKEKDQINDNIKQTNKTRTARLKNLKKNDYKIGDKNIGNKLREFQLNDTNTLNIIKDYIQNTHRLDHTAFETGALKKLFTVVDDAHTNKIIDALFEKIKLNEKLNDLQKDIKIYKLQQELGINQ